ncbi:MAG: PQQ-dependent sugar dehydrogenase [Planctomycetota bacterium]
MLIDGGSAAADEDVLAGESLMAQAIALGGREVAIGEFKVEVWRKGPVAAERIIQLGQQYFVLERGTGEVLPGWSEKPDKIEVSTWSSPEKILSRLALPPMPTAAEGVEVRSVFIPQDHGVRVTGDPTGRWLYVLSLRGMVERYDMQADQAELFADPKVYLSETEGEVSVMGLCFDDQQRMYLVVNVRDEDVDPIMHHVTIYRSIPIEHGGELGPELTPWVEVSYPWGGHQFNHGVAHIRQGSDGMMYVGSGSRTDADEDFDEPNVADGGEVELTSCIWRIDPNSGEPQIEIYAQGLRNAFGFDWDAGGNLWASENGPNKNPPGELNVVEAGKHYGFPYRFSDWEENPYEHVGAPPADLKFEPPVINQGPAGIGEAAESLATFEAHSSPAGVAYLGDAFGEPWRGALAVTRFGNMVPGETVGYDLLLVRPLPVGRAYGPREVQTTVLLERLARPLGVYAAPTGRLYVLEYSRQEPGRRSWAAAGVAGRLLELRLED